MMVGERENRARVEVADPQAQPDKARQPDHFAQDRLAVGGPERPLGGVV